MLFVRGLLWICRGGGYVEIECHVQKGGDGKIGGGEEGGETFVLEWICVACGGHDLFVFVSVVWQLWYQVVVLC